MLTVNGSMRLNRGGWGRRDGRSEELGRAERVNEEGSDEQGSTPGQNRLTLTLTPV